MAKFKIDLNSYQSDSFPVALFKWESTWPWGGKWKHYQSFETKEAASEAYEKIRGVTTGLPIYL